MKTYNLTIPVSSTRLADLITTAMEGNDPVTVAARGGWCFGIYYRTRGHEPPAGIGPWYARVRFYESTSFQIEVLEVADENKFERQDDDEATIEHNIKNGALVPHILRRRHLLNGLALMAAVSGAWLGRILDQDYDAADADTFLQLAALGEVRYG